MKYRLCFFLVITLASCARNNHDTVALLKSSDVNEQIRGAQLARETKDTTYVPYLLNNLGDPSTSTSLEFKGISVYQAKANALSKILGVTTPNKISWIPDSVNIKFFNKIRKH